MYGTANLCPFPTPMKLVPSRSLVINKLVAFLPQMNLVPLKILGDVAVQIFCDVLERSGIEETRIMLA